jgi:hypothetical protein
VQVAGCRVFEKTTGKKYSISQPEDYTEVWKDGKANCNAVVKKAIHIAADIIMEKA